MDNLGRSITNTHIGDVKISDGSLAVDDDLTVDGSFIIDGGIDIGGDLAVDGNLKTDFIRPFTNGADIDIQNSAGTDILTLQNNGECLFNGTVQLNGNDLSNIGSMSSSNSITMTAGSTVAVLDNGAGVDLAGFEVNSVNADVHRSKSRQQQGDPKIDMSTDDVKVVLSDTKTFTFEDSTGDLKIHNGLRVADGSVSLPTLGFTSDSKIGLSAGLNKMSMSVNAEEALRLELFESKTPQVNISELKVGLDSLGSYRFPATDGTAGQTLTTNGGGVLSFDTIEGVTAVEQCNELLTIATAPDLSEGTANDPYAVWTTISSSTLNSWGYPGQAGIANTVTNWSFDDSATYRMYGEYLADEKTYAFPIMFRNTVLSLATSYPYLSWDVSLPNVPYTELVLNFATTFQIQAGYFCSIYVSGVPGEGVDPYVAGSVVTGYKTKNGLTWDTEALTDGSNYPNLIFREDASNAPTSYNNFTLSRELAIPPQAYKPFIGKTMRISIEWRRINDPGNDGIIYTTPETQARGIVLQRFTLTAKWCSDVSPAVNIPQSSIDHALIANLASDSHSQYALLAGRGAGQVLSGGFDANGNLTLQSTANITRGAVICNDDLKVNTIVERTGSAGVTVDGVLLKGSTALLSYSGTESNTVLEVNNTGTKNFKVFGNCQAVSDFGSSKLIGLYDTGNPALILNSGSPGNYSELRIENFADANPDLRGARFEFVGNSVGFLLIPGTTVKQMVPCLDATIDFGSATKQWKDGRFSGTVNTGALGLSTGGITMPGAPYTAGTNQIIFEKVDRNRKIVLWQNDNNDHQFYGLGTSSGCLDLRVVNAAAKACIWHGVDANNSALDLEIGNGELKTYLPITASANNTHDIGADGTAFKDAYFAGTVNTDILAVDSDFKYAQGNFEFYYDTESTTTITVANTWYPVNLTGLTTSHSSGFVVDGTTTVGEVKYTGARDRYVHCGVTISVRLASGGNDQLAFSIFDTTSAVIGSGATMIPGSEVDLFVSNNANESQSTAIHFFPRLSQNDKFQLACKNVNATDNIIMKHINCFGIASPVVP